MRLLIPPITIIKRTAKTCVVSNDDGAVWRMYIKEREDSEIMTDSAVPAKWRETYTYFAKFVEKKGAR